MKWEEISSGDIIYKSNKNSHNDNTLVYKVVEKQDKKIGKVVVLKKIIKFDGQNMTVFTDNKRYGYSPSDEEIRFAELDKTNSLLKDAVKDSFKNVKVIFR